MQTLLKELSLSIFLLEDQVEDPIFRILVENTVSLKNSTGLPCGFTDEVEGRKLVDPCKLSRILRLFLSLRSDLPLQLVPQELFLPPALKFRSGSGY